MAAGRAGGGAQVPWKADPAVAEAIADWIADQAESHPGHVLLLAARMPQDIAMGLGIQLGQRESSWRTRWTRCTTQEGSCSCRSPS